MQTLINQLNGRDYHRAENFVTRKAIQQKILNLPLYPTTTTGSFPQTGDIRVIRAKWRRQEITDAEYKAYIPLI
ncbi:MAG: hypothetical protein HRT38_19555 [Alteromonadaceae bacterium]|nr:hypothetical protein [Alteromonadaceae bacterium]